MSRTVKLISLLVLIIGKVTQQSAIAQDLALDLRRLSEKEFFRKYSIRDSAHTSKDERITKLIWSLPKTKELYFALKKKGVSTYTAMEEYPSSQQKFFIIGFYQLATEEHAFRMASYRIDSLFQHIHFQSWENAAIGTWEKLK